MRVVLVKLSLKFCTFVHGYLVFFPRLLFILRIIVELKLPILSFMTSFSTSLSVNGNANDTKCCYEPLLQHGRQLYCSAQYNFDDRGNCDTL